MKRGIVGGLAGLLLAAELIASAAVGSAGCQYGRKRSQQVRRTGPARRHLATLRGGSALDSQRREFLPGARRALRVDGSRPAPCGSRLRRPADAHRRLSRQSFAAAQSRGRSR